MGRGRSAKSIRLISAAHEILRVIQPASVRAVCYQLFTRGLLASMATNHTANVSRLLKEARECGVIPWAWIVDETREAECVSAWSDPADYFETVKRGYRKNRWQDQPVRVEVWSEKGTVRGTLAPVLHEYGVPFMVMHGFGSATVMHSAAVASVSDDRPLVVLYVGDYDPSGMGMSELDIPTRIERYGGDIDIRRIAITEADTHDPDLPHFLASTKTKDPRHRWFTESYGQRCWELDAMNPNTLRARVEDAIRDELNLGAWHQADIAEQAERESIIRIVSAWPR
jgi:hypothetical protein